MIKYLVGAVMLVTSANVMAMSTMFPGQVKLPAYKVVIVANEVNDKKDGLFHDSKQTKKSERGKK